MRKHCVERDGNEIYRDVISRKLVAHTLDGARLKFWAAAHDLEKVCGLRRLKLWALKFCRQNAEVRRGDETLNERKDFKPSPRPACYALENLRKHER